MDWNCINNEIILIFCIWCFKRVFNALNSIKCAVHKGNLTLVDNIIRARDSFLFLIIHIYWVQKILISIVQCGSNQCQTKSCWKTKRKQKLGNSSMALTRTCWQFYQKASTIMSFSENSWKLQKDLSVQQRPFAYLMI